MSSPILQHRRPVRAAHERGLAPTRTVQSPQARPSPVAGRYHCDAAGAAWWWSPEMFALHGIEPGAAEPCTDLLLGCVLPADRPRLLRALAAARGGRAFALESRVVRPDGVQLSVVVVG